LKTTLRQAVLSLVIFAGFLSFGLIGSVRGQEVQVSQDGAEKALEVDGQLQVFKCSANSLAGRYGFMVTGTIVASFPGIPPGPHANVGTVTLNNNGTLSFTGTQSFNGAIIPSTSTGIFSVNPDCTGSVTFANGVSLNFVVVDNGKELYFIQTLPGTVVSGTAKKIDSK
jgi:hypothetical protein